MPPMNEGFQLTQKVFVPPSNTALLDPVTKRRVTICNLFAKYRLSISDVVRVLDETYEKVATVLIVEGFVRERRPTPRSSSPSKHRSYGGKLRPKQMAMSPEKLSPCSVGESEPCRGRHSPGRINKPSSH